MKRGLKILALARSRSVEAVPTVFQLGCLAFLNLSAYSVATGFGYLATGLALGFVGYTLDGGKK